MRIAGPARRLGAWALDAAIAGVVFLPLNPALYSDELHGSRFTALLAASFVLLFAYLVAFDGGERGATPGKRILGLRVADADTGGPIGLRRAAVRRVVYVVGGSACYLGWLWLFANERRQSWHDKAARTVVVRVP